MADPASIDPNEPLEKGMDYAYLKEEGVRFIQQLAGQIWSDYNETDPGVTILEQLCYALTELSYRSQFPIKDLLIDEPDGKIDPHRQALFIPADIFSINPTTIDDYRKIIVDRIPVVANAWLQPRPIEHHPKVCGLYDIFVYVPPTDLPFGFSHDEIDDEIKQICQDVIDIYCAHRGLCEDYHGVTILQPKLTTVSATVTLGDNESPERILASLLFATGNFLAPRLQRHSLKQALAAGKTPDEIFNGPLLKNGFIADAQLQPKLDPIPVNQIISVMAATAGIESVDQVAIQVEGHDHRYRINDQISVEPNEILELNTFEIDKIRLVRDGVRVVPNTRRVKRELKKLWANYQTPYELKSQYKEFFGFPQGKFRDVEQYYSLQNQFPNVYGISEFGLPDGATRQRRGQAKQLKAYLLVFEQLLADFFSQLANVNQLYSIHPRVKQTYFSQSLAGSVPNVKPLLKPNYETRLKSIVARQGSFEKRRNRFLDFLLAMYAEQLDPASVTGSPARKSGASELQLIHAKEELLDHLVESSATRGQGFNYRVSPGGRNIAGMLIKSRIQLGMPVFGSRLKDFVEQTECRIGEARQDNRLSSDFAMHVEDHFVSVETETKEWPKEDEFEWLAKRLLTDGIIPNDWFHAASEIEHFRIGTLPDDRLVLVGRHPKRGDWTLFGELRDYEHGVLAANVLTAAVKKSTIASIVNFMWSNTISCDLGRITRFVTPLRSPIVSRLPQLRPGVFIGPFRDSVESRSLIWLKRMPTSEQRPISKTGLMQNAI